MVKWGAAVVISPLTTQQNKTTKKKVPLSLWENRIKPPHTKTPHQPDFLIPIAYFIYTTLILAPSNGNTKQSHFLLLLLLMLLIFFVLFSFVGFHARKFIHFLVALRNVAQAKKRYQRKVQEQKKTTQEISADSFFRHSKKKRKEITEKLYVMYGKLSHLIPTH